MILPVYQKLKPILAIYFFQQNRLKYWITTSIHNTTKCRFFLLFFLKKPEITAGSLSTQKMKNPKRVQM
jgi:hypothetical protein